MTTDTIKKQTAGPGPFLIRTSDGKELEAPHGEFLGFTRHYMMIENAKGVLDIIDPMHVASIGPINKRRKRS